LSAGAACIEADGTEGAEAGMRLIAATAPPAVIFDISEAIVVRPFSKKHETHANARFSLGTMHSEKFSEQGIGSSFQNLSAFLKSECNSFI
jgi:CTP:molybdopterin cytidylyltransferase MocA